MAVGSERGTTHLDVLALDQLYVAGSITGSVINAGTESITQVVETNISAAGTITGSVLNVTTINAKGSQTGSVLNVTTANITGVNCAGTTTGSVINVTTVGLAGTLSGGVVNGTIMNAAQYVGSRADVKGTVTGSFLVGTVNGAYSAATIPASGLKLFSVIGTSVGTTNGSYAHGLGATPAFVSLVPRSVFQGATGTEGCGPYLSAALNATHITVAAGTSGTMDVFALA